MIFAQYSLPFFALFCFTNFYYWVLPDPAANVCPIAEEKQTTGECSKKFLEIEKMPVKYVKVGDKVLLECPQSSDSEETLTYAWTVPDESLSQQRQSLRRRRRDVDYEPYVFPDFEEEDEKKTDDDKESGEEEPAEISTLPQPTPTNNQPKIDLEILNAGQNGQYVCDASNSKQKLRRVYKIEVGTPVEIQQKNEVKPMNYVEVGKSFTQSCQATGIPEPTVKWFFNDKPIEVIGNSFEISSMEYINEGKYKCLAKNKHGIDSIEFNVAVGVKPEILHKETFHYQFAYGKPLFIDCNVAKGAIPEPKITWIVDEGQKVQLTTLDNGTLKIDSLTEKFNGYLKCVAENEIGQDEKKIDLHVCGEPYALTKQHCGNQLNESTAILHNECSMFADDRQYFLKMQSDGNFVVYKGTDRSKTLKAEWSADTYVGDTKGQYYKATLHPDGNVTVMDEPEGQEKSLKWYLPGNSATNNKPWSHKFIMQNSGRLEHILTNEQTGQTEVVWSSTLGSNNEINMNAQHKNDKENCRKMDIASCYDRGLAGPNKITPTTPDSENWN